MGNLCNGTRSDPAEEVQIVHEIKINQTQLSIIKSNIQVQPVKCILNASNQPNDHPLMQLPEMKKEKLQMGEPKLVRIAPGYCIPEFLLNLHISATTKDANYLVKCFENAFFLLEEHELDSVAFKPQQFASGDLARMHCESIIEAIFNAIAWETTIKHFLIVEPDYNVCQQYRNEMKKQHTIYCKRLFQSMNPQNILLGDALETIQEQTERNSEIGNTFFADRLKQNRQTAYDEMKENISPVMRQTSYSTGL